MQTIKKSALFTEIKAEEAAEINGACWYYHNPCWSPCSCSWSGGGSGGSFGGGSVTQTTNVNVLIDD